LPPKLVKNLGHFCSPMSNLQAPNHDAQRHYDKLNQQYERLTEVRICIASATCAINQPTFPNMLVCNLLNYLSFIGARNAGAGSPSSEGPYSQAEARKQVRISVAYRYIVTAHLTLYVRLALAIHQTKKLNIVY
jgi:hypothetical protein